MVHVGVSRRVRVGGDIGSTMNAAEFKLANNRMFVRNKCIGYVEDGKIFVFQNDEAVEIGSFDHPSEVYGIVQAWVSATEAK